MEPMFKLGLVLPMCQPPVPGPGSLASCVDGRCCKTVLGEGRAELLDAIQHKRSIIVAATAVGMSYRHAWTMIREINEAAGVKLVEDAAGGSRGGGARLTDDGILTLGVYKRVRDSIRKSVATAVELTVEQKLEKSRSRGVQK
jgi:molybdate transport system regulatory protein